MNLGVSGHRPQKCLNKAWSTEQFYQLVDIATESFKRITDLYGTVEHVHLGMAAGWDIACAYVAYEQSIPFTAFIPLSEAQQRSKWNRFYSNQHERLCRRAKEIVTVSSLSFTVSAFERNQMIVDASDVMLFLYNGELKGGTAQAWRYAGVQQKQKHNAWHIYKAQTIKR